MPRKPLAKKSPYSAESKSAFSPTEIARNPSAGALGAVLLGLVLVAFLPAIHNGFIHYDDGVYVAKNRHVQTGLSWEAVRWAFVSQAGANWHPLTWLSHLVDCQIFGLRAWGHHLTSVLLHALNALLLFLILRRTTGATWRSFLAAALFGLHPLRVESVAWVAERKDVLSGFFFMLTLLAYVKYVSGVRCQVSGGERGSRGEGRGAGDLASPITHHASRLSIFYFLSIFFFAAGLMSKPMLVTVPFLLLLLDYWPLKRVSSAEDRVPRSSVLSSIVHGPSSILRLLLEKVPFIVLSAICSAVTFFVQRNFGAMRVVGDISWRARMGNALVSYCRYLGKLFWPVDLAVFYPHPGNWPAATILGASFLLAGISLWVLVAGTRQPYLLLGWLWFLVTLVPVIGLVQVGGQAMADRYTYIPSIGIFLLLVWEAHGLWLSWGQSRTRRTSLTSRMGLTTGAGVVAAALLVTCVLLTRRQARYWKDDETLFGHAMAATRRNYFAALHLGECAMDRGELDEAIRFFKESLGFNPAYAEAQSQLGMALFNKGDAKEGMKQLEQAVREAPQLAAAHGNLGNALYKTGRFPESVREYDATLRADPDSFEAHLNLGLALSRIGRVEEGLGHLREAIKLEPGSAEAHRDFAFVLAVQGRREEAIAELRQALELRPDDADARRQLEALGGMTKPE